MALGNQAKPTQGNIMQAIPKRQLRAIAYQLADEIETRALALMAKNRRLTRVDAVKLAIDAMARG